jgi:hypothetical protein
MATRYSGGSLRRGSKHAANDSVQLLVQAYRDLAEDVRYERTMDKVIEIGAWGQSTHRGNRSLENDEEDRTNAVAEILYDLVERLRIIAFSSHRSFPKPRMAFFDPVELKMELRGQEGPLLVGRRGVGRIPDGHVVGKPCRSSAY